MAKLTWKNAELEKRLEELQISNAWLAAQYEERQLKANAPVYSGPPRANGRKPGTMRDGIKAVKLRKWSRVTIPHPGVFVEYGGTVRDEKGTFLGKRAPRPFMIPTLEGLKKYFENLHKNRI